MKLAPGRRQFVKTLLGGAAALSLRAESSVSATKLAGNIVQITGAGSNVLLVTGPDGSLVIDGGLGEKSADLLKLIAEHSKAPVQVLFNTHWHHDHVGLNEPCGKNGAKIVAHQHTKEWLTAEVIVEWEHRTYKPLPDAALPNQTFYTTGKMTFGAEQIVYGHLPQAHTDGDIYVYLPGPNILMTGDVFSVGQYPILDYSSGGWIGGNLQGMKTLVGVANADTRVIPGNGPVQTKADLEAQLDMDTKVMERLVKMVRQGYGAKDMLAAAPTKEFDAKWGSPELFINNAYKGMWGHVRELGGIV